MAAVLKAMCLCSGALISHLKACPSGIDKAWLEAA